MKIYKLIIDLENPIDKVIKVPENTDWGLHIWPINTKMVKYPLKFKLTGEGLDEKLTVGYKNVNEERENIDVYYGDYDKTWPDFKIQDTLPKRDAGEKLTWTYEIVSREPVEWYPEVDKTIVGKVCNITVEYIKSNDNAFTVVDAGNPSAFSRGLSNYYGLLKLGEGWQEIAIGNRGTETTEANCAVSIFASSSIGICSNTFDVNAESINLNGCVYINDTSICDIGGYASITEYSDGTNISNTGHIYMTSDHVHIANSNGSCLLMIDSGSGSPTINARANEIRLVSGATCTYITNDTINFCANCVSIDANSLTINGEPYQSGGSGSSFNYIHEDTADRYVGIGNGAQEINLEACSRINLTGSNVSINTNSLTINGEPYQSGGSGSSFNYIHENSDCGYVSIGNGVHNINLYASGAISLDGERGIYINSTQICLTKFLADYGV